ncbi:hypothetical protein PBI_BEAGLE_11 [Arthrobacter phage Beagle]|nr:hypothetical protein PBI_BEAGLE_11 [Arthrobacter phage Beagle]
MNTPRVDPPGTTSHRGTTFIIVALLTLIIASAVAVFMTTVSA